MFSHQPTTIPSTPVVPTPTLTPYSPNNNQNARQNESESQTLLSSLTATLAASRCRVLDYPTPPAGPQTRSRRTTSVFTTLMPAPLRVSRTKLAAPPSKKQRFTRQEATEMETETQTEKEQDVPVTRPSVVQPLLRHGSYAAPVETCFDARDEGWSASRSPDRYAPASYRYAGEAAAAAVVFDAVNWSAPAGSETSSWVSPWCIRESEGNVWDGNWGADEPGSTRTSTSTARSPSPGLRDGRPSLARDLERVVQEFATRLACVDVFAALDVDALVAEPGRVFADHDAHRGATFMDLRRHVTRSSCWCYWCELDRSKERRGQHDATMWCGCDGCAEVVDEGDEVVGVGGAEWHCQLVKQIRKQERWATKMVENRSAREDEDWMRWR